MEDVIKTAIQEKHLWEEYLDFKFQTTFWEEFCIADTYGSDAIIKHYVIAFEQWKDNLEFLTELVLVLNLKISQWFDVDDVIGLTYDALWRLADEYALDTLKGDDLHYYLSTLD